MLNLIVELKDIELNESSEFIEKDVYLYKFPKNNSKVYKNIEGEIKYLGSTTGMTSIAHDGKSYGNLHLKNGNDGIWISGYVTGFYLDGFLVRER